MVNKQKPGEGLLCDCETSRRFVFPALLLIPHFTPAASNWTRGVLQCPLAQCTEGPGKWMGVKSWCVMKITLRGAKYILQMTERVLQLQPGMVGDGTGDTAWVGSSLLVPFYTRLTWFYFAFFGEAFNHFVKCFSPDYLWALGHGLHLRMDFAVMFSVELFHCSAAVIAMKVCGDLCKLRGSPLPAAPQSMGLIWCAVWTACGLVNIFTSNCLFFTPRRVRGLVRWMSELNQSGEILHLHKWQSVVLKLSNQNTEKNFWVCR